MLFYLPSWQSQDVRENLFTAQPQVTTGINNSTADQRNHVGMCASVRILLCIDKNMILHQRDPIATAYRSRSLGFSRIGARIAGTRRIRRASFILWYFWRH